MDVRRECCPRVVGVQVVPHAKYMTRLVSWCTLTAWAMAAGDLTSSLAPDVAEPSPLQEGGETGELALVTLSLPSCPSHSLLPLSHPISCPSCSSHSFPLPPLPPVLQLHEVVACSEGHQVGVVGGGGDGHGPRAPHIGVTELVRQGLDVVG